MSSGEFTERTTQGRTIGFQDEANVADTLNLTDCDKEPIHIPGYVQPHGVMLALTEPDLTIVQVSESAKTVLHIAAQSLLHQSLDTLLDESQMETLRGYLVSENLQAINPAKLQVGGRAFDGILHRVTDLLILELEPTQTHKQMCFPSFYHAIRASAAALQAATSLRGLVQAAADEVRHITGFDRVMVYRFDKDWNGEVIAEAKRVDMHPYLDLHYPVTRRILRYGFDRARTVICSNL